LDDGNFKEYQHLGDAAIEVLGDFTPLVERLSIDEAFADVAGCERLFGPPDEIATEIRRRVRVELGLPISVGFSAWTRRCSSLRVGQIQQQCSVAVVRLAAPGQRAPARQVLAAQCGQSLLHDFSPLP